MHDVAPENHDQQLYWNEPGGIAWTTWQERMDAQLASLGLAAIDAVAPRAGEQLLDVGCGCGHTTLHIADSVGESGTATGLDISEPMIRRARQRAGDARRTNARFVLGDAQVTNPEAAGAPFDAVVSRLGVMFFADPVAAFTNLAALTRPGGRLGFVCWQAPTRNPWMSMLGREVASLFPPQPAPDPLAPGPFAFADPERTRTVVADGGWVDVDVQPCVRTMQLFGTDDFATAVDGSLTIGAASRLLLTASEEQRTQARTVAERVMRSFWTEGGAMLDGSCWLVTARRPD
jgi:SAM-dependent methyltransferase